MPNLAVRFAGHDRVMFRRRSDPATRLLTSPRLPPLLWLLREQSKLFTRDLRTLLRYYDSGWVDGTPGVYEWQAGYILDHKFVDQAWSVFQNTAINGVFDDFYQQNRIVINDCALNESVFLFPDHHFQKIKTGNTSWKMVEL